MSDRSCQFEYCNSNFILSKISSIKPVFDSANLWYLKLGREQAPTIRLRSPIFQSDPYGYRFHLKMYPYGFSAAIGTWVMVSIFISAGEYNGILKWFFSKSNQLTIRSQLEPFKAWTQKRMSETNSSNQF